MNETTKKKFVRRFDESQINLLKNPNDLFVIHISDDIASGNVFPAFRNNSIDFYHKGGKAFHFSDGKYSTHIKYASVLQGHNKPYINEADLKKSKLIADFKNEGYTRIKENCSLYSGVEAAGLSRLFTRSSYALSNSHTRPNIVVLDIEVSLQSFNEKWDDELEVKGKKRTQDRIDLLLYDTGTQTLQFFEVKHFSNSELWAQKGTKPCVVDQVKRYNQQLNNETKHKEIIAAYQDYVKSARSLFGLTIGQLPDPLILKSEVILLVFGFDTDQKNKIERLLIADGSLKEISSRFFGNPVTASSVWNEKTVQKNLKHLSANDL